VNINTKMHGEHKVKLIRVYVDNICFPNGNDNLGTKTGYKLIYIFKSVKCNVLCFLSQTAKTAGMKGIW
jgi:hypothetical protein